MTTATRAKNLVRIGRMTTRSPLHAIKNLQRLKFFRERAKFPMANFVVKHRIYQESEKFILKTAETQFELRQMLKLRHDIFYTEWQGKETEDHLDVDAMDNICDHLIIIDKVSSKVVGTYRVISSTFSNQFYSESEFHLEEFLRSPGNKLELGRACIHKDFRNGAIIHLLWKGISAYVKATNADYLFGCSSVLTTDPLLASKILAYMKKEGFHSEEFSISPTVKYLSPISQEDIDGSMVNEVPALVQSYMKAGAKFYGTPALDRDFNCYDYFMVLKMEEMNPLFRRRLRIDK